VGWRKKPEVEHHTAEIRKLGIEVCYFTKSEEAIEHSQKIGLVAPTEEASPHPSENEREAAAIQPLPKGK
jgi:hypothetical protein